MPADLIGTNVMVEAEGGGARSFRFERGPIFANVVLADEINRATLKTQSALLEAMQERSVTVAGHTHKLDGIFFVLATQNPIEMEGTYPLPEAQLDRFFFKLLVPFPSTDEIETILDRTTEAQVPKRSCCSNQVEFWRCRAWPAAFRSRTKYAATPLMS
jgi:MoxR-like ATPase